MTLTLEKQLSFEKVDNLNKQKKIIASLTKLKKDDIELALIQFNGKSAQLQNEIEKLHNIYKYSLSEKYLLRNQDEYMKDLQKLSQLTKNFNQCANDYYDIEDDKAQEKIDEQKLKDAFAQINNHIHNLILKNIVYEKYRFELFRNLSVFTFFVVFIASLWYRKRLTSIYKDIQYLYSIDKQKEHYTIFSQEADAIYLRMKRKTVTTDNPTFTDQVTGINNLKGLVNSYANKKGMKDSNFTSVTILEIDNFSKSNRTYNQELTQNILKKIAFTISLHEQPTDVIAKTDYNQFTVVLSRTTKEQLYKDMEIIRQSISELKFNLPDGDAITVTGGFVVKPNNTNIEEALKQSAEILSYADKIGRNKILQTRDITDLHI
jgi:diguanylate cyclase (GGDEF)-like protein